MILCGRSHHRDPRQPPRPPTAYILFNSDRRAGVIDAHAKEVQAKRAESGAGTLANLTMVEATKILAQQWREASPEEKQPVSMKSFTFGMKFHRFGVYYIWTEPGRFCAVPRIGREATH